VVPLPSPRCERTKNATIVTLKVRLSSQEKESAYAQKEDKTVLWQSLSFVVKVVA
jgi:hypothetical protein